MRRGFERDLKCFRCKDSSWSLSTGNENDREVVGGQVRCETCSDTWVITDGILDTIDPSDEKLRNEVQGWHELAGELPESLITTMTALPYYPHGEWPNLAPDFFQLFEEIDFRGKRVVDIGAGRTWSTRFVMTMGEAADAVAIDVLTKRFLGLSTSDVFFKEDAIYFERLRSDIHHIPLRDGWADIVISVASVHHSGDIRKLFGEVARILKPGGIFAFVSEPTKNARIKERQPVNTETEHGINEHFYHLGEYTKALRQAGFSHRRLIPRSVPLRLFRMDADFAKLLPPSMAQLAKSRAGRAFLCWLLARPRLGAIAYRYASFPVSMISVKVA